jgi:hypothetical protein
MENNPPIILAGARVLFFSPIQVNNRAYAPLSGFPLVTRIVVVFFSLAH